MKNLYVVGFAEVSDVPPTCSSIKIGVYSSEKKPTLRMMQDAGYADKELSCTSGTMSDCEICSGVNIQGYNVKKVDLQNGQTITDFVNEFAKQYKGHRAKVTFSEDHLGNFYSGELEDRIIIKEEVKEL